MDQSLWSFQPSQRIRQTQTRPKPPKDKRNNKMNRITHVTVVIIVLGRRCWDARHKSETIQQKYLTLPYFLSVHSRHNSLSSDGYWTSRRIHCTQGNERRRDIADASWLDWRRQGGKNLFLLQFLFYFFYVSPWQPHRIALKENAAMRQIEPPTLSQIQYNLSGST